MLSLLYHFGSLFLINSSCAPPSTVQLLKGLLPSLSHHSWIVVIRVSLHALDQRQSHVKALFQSLVRHNALLPIHVGVSAFTSFHDRAKPALPFLLLLHFGFGSSIFWFSLRDWLINLVHTHRESCGFQVARLLRSLTAAPYKSSLSLQ